jgi:hypothetical protein
MFNAAILYAAANSLAFRGQSLRRGISPEIEKEAKSLLLPRELLGQAPYLWQFGTHSFRVVQVQPYFAGGELDLKIQQEVSTLGDGKPADDLNHALIRDITSAYPELFDSFEAIIVEAVEAGGIRTFRTVQYGPKGPPIRQ